MSVQAMLVLLLVTVWSDAPIYFWIRDFCIIGSQWHAVGNTQINTKHFGETNPLYHEQTIDWLGNCIDFCVPYDISVLGCVIMLQHGDVMDDAATEEIANYPFTLLHWLYDVSPFWSSSKIHKQTEWSIISVPVGWGFFKVNRVLMRCCLRKKNLKKGNKKERVDEELHPMKIQR